jgi:transposase
LFRIRRIPDPSRCCTSSRKPHRKNRIVKIRHDKAANKQRWRIEAAIGRRKDFRLMATRDDKLARTFRDTVALAAIYMFWL